MSGWEDKSNFEINKSVSDLLDFDGLTPFFNDKQEVVYLCDKNGVDSIYPVRDFNPCKNPSDAWSIILENQISLFNSDNDLWSAQKWVSDKRISHEFVRGRNALRAAMIVYLEMNGVKP